MTFYQNFQKTKKAETNNRRICACGKHYILGVNGTVDGCDDCQDITRNLDGTIIEANGFFLDDDALQSQ
jgi:hypothetical protein